MSAKANPRSAEACHGRNSRSGSSARGSSTTRPGSLQAWSRNPRVTGPGRTMAGRDRPRHFATAGQSLGQPEGIWDDCAQFVRNISDSAVEGPDMIGPVKEGGITLPASAATRSAAGHVPARGPSALSTSRVANDSASGTATVPSDQGVLDRARVLACSDTTGSSGARSTVDIRRRRWARDRPSSSATAHPAGDLLVRGRRRRRAQTARHSSTPFRTKTSRMGLRACREGEIAPGSLGG